jgi:HlyD family secretion protein
VRVRYRHDSASTPRPERSTHPARSGATRRLAEGAAITAVMAVVAVAVLALTCRAALELATPAGPPWLTGTLRSGLDTVANRASFGAENTLARRGQPELGTLLTTGVAALCWLAFAVAAVWLIHTVARRAEWRHIADRPPSRVRRRAPLASRVLFLVVAVACMAQLAVFGGNYLAYGRYYISTDNAVVDGDKIEIKAPVSGTASGWLIDQGSEVRPHQMVGHIRPVGGGARPAWPVFAPKRGTIVVNDVVNGSFVRQGTELATAYDLANIYITARVDSTEIASVQPGASVDITADAYPGVAMSGVVDVAEAAAAAQFHPTLADGTVSGTAPADLIQYFPVKIKLFDTGGQRLIPGMNVTARIHKP